ncbi:hybrid sensor histidine kinase/response regulator [Myxacorys almedinensis]|uniref:histidine kinase n=1 Tax=Myxacorys almedinensis A TaxID=2690445 RepID=A0A8J7YZ04_9CYAN|nr:ATP-binding protein [Myxacorys almedinensis]NDJ17187.1 response regulator [Myxacorys almedinensis A]
MSTLIHRNSAGSSAMVGERIVIVEDESVVALNLRLRLELAHFQVEGVADSGKTAIALIAETLPDLVLMDIRLKGSQTGIQVAEEIQKRWNIPVIYLTGYTDETTLRKLKHTSPYGYLLKPFEPTELYTAIEIALNQHHTQTKLQSLNTDLERRVQARTEELELINQRLQTEILERKRAEAETLQALEKERELSDLKSRFITTTSHEFRTPLSIVLTSAELLERMGVDCTEERRSRYFLKIRDAVRSMTTILADMLTLGKASAGTLEFHPASFDLKKFCHSLLSDLQLDPLEVRASDRPSHRSIVLDYDPRAANAGEVVRTQVELDPDLLGLILSNLLSNAVKYSLNEAKIRLAIHFVADAEGRSSVVLQVQDHGMGIPAEDMPRLFESFHRAKNVDTISGTGLGLAIVHQCVKLHGGDIQIDSELGQGTTVTVTLPLP